MAGISPSPSVGRQNKPQYYSKSEFCVLREEPGGKEWAKCQLERALEKQYKVVIIEPSWQGDNAIRWIRFGNFLHKTAVLSCLGGLVLVPLVPNKLLTYVPLPLGVLGVSCAALYDLSWQFDPCCKYQVDREGRELTHIPSHELHSSSPVVLVFKNDKYRKRLHNILALATCAIIGWRLYSCFYCQSQ